MISSEPYYYVIDIVAVVLDNLDSVNRVGVEFTAYKTSKHGCWKLFEFLVRNPDSPNYEVVLQLGQMQVGIDGIEEVLLGVEGTMRGWSRRFSWLICQYNKLTYLNMNSEQFNLLLNKL